MKRIFALLLALVIVLGAFPKIDTYATETEEAIQETVETIADPKKTDDEEVTEVTEDTTPATEETEEIAQEIIVEELDVLPVESQSAAVIDSGVCGENITWTLSSDGLLKISGTGTMYNFTSWNNPVPWTSNCDIIKKVEISEGVLKISDDAFYSCVNLRSITMPSSLLSVGWDAFALCNDLTDIYISDLTAWMEIAFADLLSNPLTTNTKSKNLYLNGELLTNLAIPEGMTSIPAERFAYLGCLQSVKLSSTLTEIGSHAFQNCINLKTVEFNKNAKTIDRGAFYGCTSLKNISIGDGVTTIADDAFYSCNNLKSITIPSSVVSVGWGAFALCNNLTDIYISDLTAWMEIAFADLLSNPLTTNSNSKNLYLNGELLTDLIIPEGITFIPTERFAYLDCLQSVTIPDSVISIGDSAFSCCQNLTKIEFLGDAPQIGESAFYNVEAKAFCPDLASWTDAKKQSYGGNLTWLVAGACDHESLTTVAAKEATCAVSGNNKYLICDLCGIIIKADGITATNVNAETIPALGHAPGEEATCEKGQNCTRCGVELQPALGHNPGSAATCTDPQKCARCGMELVAALGHNYKAEVVVEPTYLTPGYTQYTCTRCGDSYQDSFTAALGLPVPAVTVANDPVTGGALLTWEAIEGADSYEVYRATSSKGKYTLVDTVTDAEAVVSVAVGKTHYFKVKAVCNEDSGLSSDFSQAVKVSGKCAQPQVSADANTSGKPVLKWNKVTGAKKYYIYRVAEDGKLTSLGNTTKTTYTDSKAKAGTEYTYVVRANGSKTAYNSAYSDAVSCLVRCAQPSVSVKVDATTGKAVLSWKTVSGAESYLIQRRLEGEEQFIAIVEVEALKYTDLDAPIDTDAEYRVIAQTTGNTCDSAPSAAKKVHIAIARPDVVFAVDEVTGKPSLTWDEVDGAVEYKVYRSTKATSSYKAVKTTDDLEYTDTSASVGKGYYYKVIAVGENCKSAYSAYKKLTAKCAQPDVTLEVNSKGQPVLKWSKVSGAKKYYVYRIDENGKQTTLGNTTKTSYTDKKAKSGQSYTYRVRAYGAKTAYNSVYSEDVIFTGE